MSWCLHYLYLYMYILVFVFIYVYTGICIHICIYVICIYICIYWLSNTISILDYVRVVLTVTRWVSLVEQEWPTLPDHPWSLSVLVRVRVAQSSVFHVMFSVSLYLYSFCSLFFGFFFNVFLYLFVCCYFFVCVDFFLSATELAVLRIAVSDYTFDIFKLFIVFPLTTFITRKGIDIKIITVSFIIIYNKTS